MKGRQDARSSAFGLARIALASGLLLALLGGLSPAAGGKRVELYATDGQYAGYALVNRQEGRVDYYDARGRRVGWARVNRFSDHYWVDLSDAGGFTRGYAVVDRAAGRVEFFDAACRLVGSGLIDKRGRVSGTDLSGNRRDTVLPVPPRVRAASREQPDD